ncbi:hypothetical protein [Streptomyces sp. RLB3-6]|uniref:hypothetical protein n=1 Tax=Streptomyces sp. RLB3-6 TaxID=2594457 RepID=UPI001164A691|nr:hypothetical protein [Streptomyces sp. RLB3-6]QDN93414.1 hypothetical protein FNV61_55970 [Streptomyces sp. RLB3-6]
MVGTALRLTRQGFLQPFMEEDLCVACLDGVHTRGAGAVRVVDADVCGEGGGDHVAVCDQIAARAGVHAVGEGFADGKYLFLIWELLSS